MKIGLNYNKKSFNAWSRDFEKNVTGTVILLFNMTSGVDNTVGQAIHETMGFILTEAGISPEMLHLFEFLSEDDKPGMEGDDHASKEL